MGRPKISLNVLSQLQLISVTMVVWDTSRPQAFTQDSSIPGIVSRIEIATSPVLIPGFTGADSVHRVPNFTIFSMLCITSSKLVYVLDGMRNQLIWFFESTCNGDLVVNCSTSNWPSPSFSWIQRNVGRKSFLSALAYIFRTTTPIDGNLVKALVLLLSTQNLSTTQWRRMTAKIPSIGGSWSKHIFHSAYTVGRNRFGKLKHTHYFFCFHFLQEHMISIPGISKRLDLFQSGSMS